MSNLVSAGSDCAVMLRRHFMVFSLRLNTVKSMAIWFILQLIKGNILWLNFMINISYKPL